MRVLVTGATGFVGYAVAKRLVDEGHRVCAMTRGATGDLPDGVQRVVGDLLDASSVQAAVALAAPEATCHLAASVRVRESRIDPVGYWQTNLGGTLALLAALAAHAHKPRSLVLASTCAVYGDQAEQPIGEDARPEPSNPYGASKLAADWAAADLADTGAIGAISLRSFNVAGGLPGHPDLVDSRLIPTVVAVAQGRAAELTVNGDGSAIRDYVHVLDMADAFVRALAACEPGVWQAYNIGSGRRSSIADVIAMTERLTNRPLPVRHQPAAPEPLELAADSSLFIRKSGWKPQHSDLDQIIGDALSAAETAYSPAE